MPSILAYHRPASLTDALELLGDPSRRALAGGTMVVPASRVPSDGVELVDLQALGLDTIGADGDCVRLGAMLRLGDAASDERVPELLRELCRRELPSTLRNAATVGGTVAMAASGLAAESVLVAGLLVHDATVELAAGDGSPMEVPLAELLTDGLGGRLVTSVSVVADGQGVVEATGRTPADVPIVAAVARADGGAVRLALTGVAPAPVVVDPGDPTAGLEPPADFRGTSTYRLHLVDTLAGRVLEALGARQ